MILTEDQLKELKECFNHDRYEWESYYAAQHYYKRGVLDALSSLGIPEEQMSQIDEDGDCEDWDWRKED